MSADQGVGYKYPNANAGNHMDKAIIADMTGKIFFDLLQNSHPLLDSSKGSGGISPPFIFFTNSIIKPKAALLLLGGDSGISRSPSLLILWTESRGSRWGCSSLD